MAVSSSSCFRRKRPMAAHWRPDNRIVKFGVPIDEVCGVYNEIPGPLLVLILKLNKEAPYKKDVFRAPGHQASMKKLVHFLQSGRLVNIDHFSVYTIASVLKKFLRKLPGGIFGPELEAELFEIIQWDAAELDAKREHIHALMESLPTVSQHLLVLLFGTFRAIAATSDRANTGMTAEALGVSVAPSFFQSCVQDGSKIAKMEDVQRFKAKIATATLIMKFMIDNFGVSNLFGRDNYEYYARMSGRVLRFDKNWIYDYRYPQDSLDLSHRESDSATAGPLGPDSGSLTTLATSPTTTLPKSIFIPPLLESHDRSHDRSRVAEPKASTSSSVPPLLVGHPPPLQRSSHGRGPAIMTASTSSPPPEDLERYLTGTTYSLPASVSASSASVSSSSISASHAVGLLTAATAAGRTTTATGATTSLVSPTMAHSHSLTLNMVSLEEAEEDMDPLAGVSGAVGGRRTTGSNLGPGGPRSAPPTSGQKMYLLTPVIGLSNSPGTKSTHLSGIGGGAASRRSPSHPYHHHRDHSSLPPTMGATGRSSAGGISSSITPTSGEDDLVDHPHHGTRSLTFLHKVHERQTQRMKTRSEWFLTASGVPQSRQAGRTRISASHFIPQEQETDDLTGATLRTTAVTATLTRPSPSHTPQLSSASPSPLPPPPPLSHHALILRPTSSASIPSAAAYRMSGISGGSGSGGSAAPPIDHRTRGGSRPPAGSVEVSDAEMHSHPED